MQVYAQVTSEEIELSLIPKCDSCGGTGGPDHAVSKGYCSWCFGIGLLKFKEIPHKAVLVTPLYQIADAKAEAGEKYPWHLASSILSNYDLG